MKVLTTHMHRERRAQSDPPSPAVSHENMRKLLESPYFKRVVQLEVNLRCRQAIKDGKIRLASPKNPIYTPRVDIVDDSSSSRVVATFELPGVRNDEVTMHLHDGKLHIQGERFPRAVPRTPGREAPSSLLFSGNSNEEASNTMVTDTPPPGVARPTQELKYGKFQRALDVPSGLRHSEITARFQDGMLIVTWPRPCASDTSMPGSDSHGIHPSVANEEHS